MVNLGNIIKNPDKLFCGWCNMWFRKNISKIRGKGKKGNATSQAVCPGCNNNVSQK